MFHVKHFKFFRLEWRGYTGFDVAHKQLDFEVFQVPIRSFLCLNIQL